MRVAYIEALYHAEEFEFNRLSQSFWHDLIYQVSKTKSITDMLLKFPMRAEDSTFTRPLNSFNCVSPITKVNTCGPGTKRTPIVKC